MMHVEEEVLVEDPNFAIGYDFEDGLGTGQRIGDCVNLPSLEVTKWLVKELVVYGGDDWENVVIHAWNLNTREHYYAREDGEWDRDTDDKRAPRWMGEPWDYASNGEFMGFQTKEV